IVRSDIEPWPRYRLREDEKTGVLVIGSDVSKIHFNLSDFKIMFPRSTDFDHVCLVYENLMKSFKDRGQSIDYKWMDITDQAFKDPSQYKWQSNFSNWWWDFGYNKG